MSLLEAYDKFLAATDRDHAAGNSCAQPRDTMGCANEFAAPVPLSRLQEETAAGDWLLFGYLRPASITLLTALWKCGKTTLLSHLLEALSHEGEFCGLEATPARVLVVTEEPAALWIEHRDRLGIGDHVDALVRPLKARPTWKEWTAFLERIAGWTKNNGYQLIVIDPLPNFWPVSDENDASQVIAALTPLRRLTDLGAAVLLNMHPRKSDGAEGTAARGSGALAAFPDILIEMRRMNPTDRRDRRRVLTGLSRYRETPAELVVELSPDETAYTALGDRAEAGGKLRDAKIEAILTADLPGQTVEEILVAWPDEKKPAKRTLEIALKAGAHSNRWLVGGAGVKGDPLRYRLPTIPTTFPFSEN